MSRCRLPTEHPEPDGTLAWDATTLVPVEIRACGACDLGYGHADKAAAMLIAQVLKPTLEGMNAPDTGGCRARCLARLCNIGTRGITTVALAARDVALHDLTARCSRCRSWTCSEPVAARFPPMAAAASHP